jgi:hypothetical protein
MKIKILVLALLLLSCSRSGQRISIKPTESWLGVYLAQSKIGYSLFKFQVLPNGYQFISRAKMKLKMMEQESEINSNFSCFTDTSLVMNSFDMDFLSKRRSFSAQGKIINSKLEITIKSGGETKSSLIDAPANLYPAIIVGNVVAFHGLAEGKEYNFKVFEPTVLNITDAHVVIEKKEKIKIENQEYNAWKLNFTMLGLTSTMWIDSTGERIREESPPGISMIKETPQQALANESGVATLDILSLFSIRVDSMIPDPRNVSYLKVSMKNIDTTNLILSDELQNVVSYNPIVLEIKSQPKPVEKVILPIKQESEFLKPSLCIQSDNPKLREKAAAIIRGSKDGGDAVQKLVAWVYNNINKRATASLPSAIDVLANLEGDCNEHAVLFAGLARAIGIPTKIAVGVVYLDKAFYYHAWNKVYLGKWISVDPTFGQFPADATHIKLQEGELSEQAKVLKIVGAVKIEIMEFN